VFALLYMGVKLDQNRLHITIMISVIQRASHDDSPIMT